MPHAKVSKVPTAYGARHLVACGLRCLRRGCGHRDAFHSKSPDARLLSWVHPGCRNRLYVWSSRSRWRSSALADRQERSHPQDLRRARALPGRCRRLDRRTRGQVRGKAGVCDLPRVRDGPPQGRAPQGPDLRGVPRPRGGAHDVSRRHPASRSEGSRLLPSLPRLQRGPTHRVPADRSGGAQPSRSVHHLPRAPRAGTPIHARGMQRLPRADLPAEGRVASREVGVHGVPRGPRGPQDSPRDATPTRPTTRAFCGQCHAGTPPPGLHAPQIDLAAHNPEYLCWQCHYPHYPEAGGD